MAASGKFTATTTGWLFPLVSKKDDSMARSTRWLWFASAVTACCCLTVVWAQDLPDPSTENIEPAKEAAAKPGSKPAVVGKKFGAPPGGKRLNPKADVWLDAEKKVVIIDGEICLREGPLEMFACLKGTKEHESVIAVNTLAYYVHAALLAVGAKVGNTVKFDPQYTPATGTEIEITLLWYDEKGTKQQARAQDWILNEKTKKPMTQAWVFAGSGFWFDEETGREHYQAEAGDFICVSNFPTAMLDVPIESSQANTSLLFQANTEKIPPIGTPVRLVLRPKLDDVKKDDAEKK